MAHIAADTHVDGTRVGGLSGLDRLADGRWVLISDDRSLHAPARFYVASLALSAGGIGAVRIDAAVTLRDVTGRPYPAPGQGSEAVDPEAIRVDPRDGTLWWSSEGDAVSGAPQSIRHSARDGTLIADMPLPAPLLQRPDAGIGPRPNLAFEALAWSHDGGALWAVTEGPLLQDGALPDARRGAPIRFNLLDRAGVLLSQRLYRTEPVPPHADGLRSENGISDILAVDDAHMLVMERSVQEQADGRYVFGVKLFCTRLGEADEVAARPSLAAHAALRAAPKRLLLDLGGEPSLAGRNLEGMAWGPVLADGRATLLLVEDNNFIDAAPTVLALLATSAPRTPGWAASACGG